MGGQTDLVVCLRHWPMPALVLDGHARVVVANVAMEQVLAAKPGALADRFLAEWVKDAAAFASFLRDGGTTAAELDFRRGDGGERRLALSLARGVAAGNDLLCAVDVSLARMTERSLRLERDRYLDMIRASSAWFYETETVSQSETKVEAWVRLVRSGPDGNVSQRELHTKWPERVVDPSYEPETLAEFMRKLNARAPIRNFLHRQARSDGKERYLRASGVPYMRDGVYVGYRGVSIDVTAEILAKRALSVSELRLRRARHRLARAQRAAGVGSAERDLMTGNEEWSDEFCRLFGLDPAGKPEMDRLLSLVHEDDREWMKAAAVQAAAGRAVEPRIIRVRLSAGDLRMLLVETDFLCDEQGRPDCIFTFVKDVTAEQAAGAPRVSAAGRSR